jgi:hypothetical protein
MHSLGLKYFRFRNVRDAILVEEWFMGKLILL